MSKSAFSTLAILIVLSGVAGCSGRGSDPITAGSQPQAVRPFANSAHTHMWGCWDVCVDAENETVEAVLNRHAMFTLNVVGILNNNPATLGFMLKGIVHEMGNTYINLEVSITHPIPGKSKFNGYDVRGVLMGNGSATMLYNSDLKYPVPGLDQLQKNPYGGPGGPDGYTRWFNLTEFSTGGMPLFSYVPGKYATKDFAGTATLCPYRYFADGLGTYDSVWNFLTATTTHGVFTAGSKNTRCYHICFPDALGIKFGYAVIANWEGSDPWDHPSNAPESVACSVADASDVWYIDPTLNGGMLNLDISLFSWKDQPSAIYIESTVLTSVYEFDMADMTPVGGSEHYSTYHVEIPADNVTGLEGQEFWVIAEHGDYDYTNDFGVPNLADTDPLAAFFRFEHEVAEEPACPTPDVLSISPSVVNPDTFMENAKIECLQLVDGPWLAVKLAKDGEPDIEGMDVSFVPPSFIKAHFNLAGAVAGFWDVVVVNGCGGLPGVGEGLLEISACHIPMPVSIDPDFGEIDSAIDDALITCDEIEEGPCLGAFLSLDGQMSVTGTDLQFLGSTQLTADFDLSGVSAGLWDVVLINGCCSSHGIGEDMFQVVESTGPVLRDSGPLPEPHPVTNFVDFCVIGDDWGGEGVYYHYSTGSDFLIYRYPVDYSAEGTQYCELTGNGGGFDIEDLLIGPEWMSAIEISAAGLACTGESTDPMVWGGYPANEPLWWFDLTGLLMMGYRTPDLVSFDIENEFPPVSGIWGYWGGYPPGTEQGRMFYTMGRAVDFPVDTVGSVDGRVSDNEAYKLAVDSEPVGLDPPHNIIYYWMEGPPDDPGIEIIKNDCSSPYYPLGVAIGTIDDDLVGLPVDITCVNSFGNVAWAEGNWLVVLEDNGDSTWQIAVFDQNGNLLYRYEPPLPGEAIAMDADYARQQVHVWYDNGGYHYAVFGWG